MNGYSPVDLARSKELPDSAADDVVEQVARVLEPLTGLASVPAVEHVVAFEVVQKSLSDILSTVDDA